MNTAKDRENKKKQLEIQKKYSQRITIVRQGFEAFRKKDYVMATEKYREYLIIFADMYEYDDIYSITPANFDKKTEVTEMLLISHVYWEMARVNETAPTLERNFQRCLSQFVKFTVNQPYQVLNAEMLRKYIKKQNGHSPHAAALNEAYKQIFIQSKKCYISTFCYGHQHPITLNLRQFRDDIIHHPYGFRFIETYYRVSSPMVDFISPYPLIYKPLTWSIKPLLFSLAIILNSSIFKLCFYSRK